MPVEAPVGDIFEKKKCRRMSELTVFFLCMASFLCRVSGNGKSGGFIKLP